MLGLGSYIFCDSGPGEEYLQGIALGGERLRVIARDSEDGPLM